MQGTDVVPDTVEWLKENPRMMGVIFSILLALSQAGQVAGWGSGNAGP